MKIRNFLTGLDPYANKVDKADAKSTKRGSDTADAKGDRVSLSSEAKLRTEAYRTALSAPEVRQEKVDAIKAKVDSGEYQVDSRKVAEKLVKEEADLFV